MEELEEAEFLAGVPLPAFVVDGRERVVAVNPIGRALIGDQALGRHLAMSLRSPELLGSIAEVLKGAGRRDVELRLSDESRFRARVSPLVARARRVLCVLTDVTAETHSETIRRDFVANVSHELRTPLTALSGFIETLQGPARDDAAARARFLGIMQAEAGRMNRLVSDLLRLSRVEAVERQRPRDQVDLAQIVRAAAATVEGVASGLQVKLILEGLDTPQPVRGDADHLTQVFVNLIENAVRYGGANREVRISCAPQRHAGSDMLAIAVQDQGEGIEAIHLPRLTERFYRVDPHRSRAAGGTGLGLAIVKHIINRHRGQLRITSQQGEGSTFTVLLPLS